MMTLISRFLNKGAASPAADGEGATSFWGAYTLPKGLPLVLGLALGVAAAALIVSGQWYYLIPLIAAGPAILLFHRYPFAAVIIWMATLPIFVATPTNAERFIYWVLHRGLIPAVLIITLVSDGLRIHKRQPMRFTWADVSILLFLLLTLISIFLTSSDLGRTLISFYDRLVPQVCMYWLIRFVAPNGQDLKRFLPAALFMLVVQCTIGLLSWFTPEAVPPQWLGLAGERTIGTLRNVAVYSSTLIFLALVLFQYAMHCQSRWQRWLLVAAFGLACFCVFFSFSRGSWLAGLIVLAMLIFIYRRVVVIVVTTVSTIAILLGNTVLAKEFAFAYERLNDVRTAEGRVIGNVASLRMIEAKPLFGWGYDTYDLYSVPFKTRVGEITASVRGTSHNTYLTIMAEQGMTAFLLYAFPVVYWLVLSAQVWRRMPRYRFWSRRLLLMLWLSILTIVIVSNFMDMVRLHPFGTAIWFLTLGLIANLVEPQRQPSRAYLPARLSARLPASKP